MNINQQGKAPMHTPTDAGATGEAPVAPASRIAPAASSEVVARATRRRFSNADKRRIVRAADACTKPGEIGALLRREGVYSSNLSTWRGQFAAGELAGAASAKRGPKVAPGQAEAKLLAQVIRERDKLLIQLSNAQLVIEVQKKVAALLEQFEPLNKSVSH